MRLNPLIETAVDWICSTIL